MRAGVLALRPGRVPSSPAPPPFTPQLRSPAVAVPARLPRRPRPRAARWAGPAICLLNAFSLPPGQALPGLAASFSSSSAASQASTGRRRRVAAAPGAAPAVRVPSTRSLCPTPPSALPAPSLCSPARPGLPRACLPLFGSIQALQAGRSMRHAADHAESVACERRLSTEEVLSLLPLVGKKVAWRLHLALCSRRPSTLPRSARKLASAPRRRRVVSGCCRSGSPSSLLGVCPRLGGWEASQFRAPWLLSWAFRRRLSTPLSEHQARESPSASCLVSWALHRT